MTHNKGNIKKSVGGVSNRFKRMAEIYRVFGSGWTDYHLFTDEKLVELFNNESYGEPLSENNGFALGKSWLNVNVAMWLEDRARGHLVLSELYEDEKFPHWWLDSIFKNK